MLILSYLGEAKNFDLEIGTNLLIVRNPPEVIPKHFIHTPQLSPSKSLFSATQEWKQEFKEKDEWWGKYEDRFRSEMKERRDMISALNRLDTRLKTGELIRVFCFCKDVCYCHRQYVGKEMQIRGHQVDFRYLPVAKPPEVIQLSLF